MTFIPKPLSHWQRYSPVECRNHDDWQTPRQAVSIRAISNAQRIDADRAAKHLFGYDAESLNKAASSTFIAWLKEQPAQRHPADALNFCLECKHLLMEDAGMMRCRQGHSYEIARIEAA